MGLVAEKGSDWLFAEIVSFFCRGFGILALSCLSVGFTNWVVEYIFATFVLVGIVINCLDFDRPVAENLVLKTAGFALHAFSTIIILCVANRSSLESNDAKYFAGIFSLLSTLGCGLMTLQFYYYCSRKTISAKSTSTKVDSNDITSQIDLDKFKLLNLSSLKKPEGFSK